MVDFITTERGTKLAEFPVTGLASRGMRESGWARLVSVSVELYLDGDDRVENGIIWLVDDEGNVWADHPARGENDVERAERYAARGYTGADACLFKAAA